MSFPCQASLELPFGERPVLDFEITAATIDLLPVRDGKPRLELCGPGASDLHVDLRKEGEVVRVRMGTPSNGWPHFWFHGRPRHFSLLVPQGLRARLRSDAGRIRVEDLAGCDLDLSTSAGQILLRDVHGRLQLRADAGQIRGERVGGSFAVESSAGEVRLRIDGLDPGTHRVHSSMGAVRVELARELSVRIEGQTSMGSTRIRYPSTPDAEAVLELVAEVGAVRVDPAEGLEIARAGYDWRKIWLSDENPWTKATRSSRATSGFDRNTTTDDEIKTILRLVERGKLKAEEADQLLHAMDAS